MSEHFAALGLEPTATVEEVKAAWKQIAYALHPDTGGDPEAFAEAHGHYLAALEIAGTCTKCNGTGRITLRNGAHSLTMPCDECQG